MTIREYAKRRDFEIIGKLTRHSELEYDFDGFTGERKHIGAKFYKDEGGNEYYVSKKGVCIVTADGGVM